MNTVVTSREQILAAARELALSGGELSMRAVAARCGIAVGSIYNYYPTKADLTIAVVAEVWQEIFHPGLCADAGSGRKADQCADRGCADQRPAFLVLQQGDEACEGFCRRGQDEAAIGLVAELPGGGKDGQSGKARPG